MSPERPKRRCAARPQPEPRIGPSVVRAGSEVRERFRSHRITRSGNRDEPPGEAGGPPGPKAQFARTSCGRNSPDRHHDLSHEGDSNTDAVNKLVEINRWYAERFAGMMERLARIPEGDGTVLDNTVIVWVNELGKGNSHTRNDMPFVIGGSGGGALRTGRFHRYDRPHNDLWLTMLRVFGIEDESFGDTRFQTGVIDNLLA